METFGTLGKLSENERKFRTGYELLKNDRNKQYNILDPNRNLWNIVDTFRKLCKFIEH